MSFMWWCVDVDSHSQKMYLSHFLVTVYTLKHHRKIKSHGENDVRKNVNWNQNEMRSERVQKKKSTGHEWISCGMLCGFVGSYIGVPTLHMPKKNWERVISRIYVSRVRWKEDLQPHCIHLLMDMAKKKSPPNKQFIQHTPFISCRTTAKKSSILFFFHREKPKLYFHGFALTKLEIGQGMDFKKNYSYYF